MSDLFSIPLFNIFGIAGFILSIAYILIKSKYENLEPSKVLSLYLHLILVGVVCGVLLYNVIYLDFSINLNIRKNSAFGSFVGILPMFFFIKKKYRKELDVLLPAFFILMAISKIGCFYAGCCYGKETSALIGVYSERAGCLVHPVQIYESVIYFISFIILNSIKANQFEFTIIFFGFVRIVSALFRQELNDTNKGYPNVNLWLAIIFFVVGLMLLKKDKISKLIHRIKMLSS